jgi:hypothetical protein
VKPAIAGASATIASHLVRESPSRSAEPIAGGVVHRDATLILIGYWHGLCASEIACLDWSQVEAEGAIARAGCAESVPDMGRSQDTSASSGFDKCPIGGDGAAHSLRRVASADRFGTPARGGKPGGNERRSEHR